MRACRAPNMDFEIWHVWMRGWGRRRVITLVNLGGCGFGEEVGGAPKHVASARVMPGR